jgi:hypothetical protein
MGYLCGVKQAAGDDRATVKIVSLSERVFVPLSRS